MTESQQQQEPIEGQDAAIDVDLSNVIQMAGHKPRHREPPATEDELAEYRRIRPLLLAMIEDWQKLRAETGCPAMRTVLGLD